MSDLELTDYTDKLQRSSCLCLPVLLRLLLYGCLRSNIGPKDYMTSNLPLKPSPLPFWKFFYSTRLCDGGSTTGRKADDVAFSSFDVIQFEWNSFNCELPFWGHVSRDADRSI